MRRVKRRDPSTLDWDPSLMPDGSRIVVALSGGADSLTLLHLLCAGRDERRWELIACHVHHGMRGESAEEDIRFLEEICRQWAVPLVIARADVPALAESQRISVEEAGRDARYAALERAANDRHCDLIVTAHTADDQAETVLMRLFRGAGIDGLAGIPRRRPLRWDREAPVVVRPMLDVWRTDIEAYCEAHHLEPRFDVTNLDLSYRRSRIRRELIPQLEAYDPHLRAHLVRIAAQAAAERELLTPAAEALFERSLSVHESFPNCLRLAITPLNDASPALTRRALRLALQRIGLHDLDGEFRIVERIVALVRAETNRGLELPHSQWKVRRVGEMLVFEKRSSHFRAGARVVIESVAPPEDARQPPHRVYIDAESVRGRLAQRVPKRGDRFRPLGAPGSRLLSDVLVDKKIPREDRGTWPIVFDDEGIVWVAGVAVAERCRVTETTRRCWLLQLDLPVKVS